MRRRLLTFLAAAALVAGTALAAGTATAGASGPGGQPGASSFGRSHRVCGDVPAGFARCHAHVVDAAAGKPGRGGGGLTDPVPLGLSPAQVKAAYAFPAALDAGGTATIAIVDAYDNPKAESDLATFSTQFGLPACTTQNGCFRKVNQTGGTRYPRANAGWALEIALDIQWAHAIAPGANILLVEASSNSFANLVAAVDYARAHAGYVSSSWGASEFSGETGYDGHFASPAGRTVSFFVSAGDNGLPAEYPSSSPNVISVGGTKLTFNADGSLASETGWSDGGGGCSLYETATTPQAAPGTGYDLVGCGTTRATPDVSLDADPASGVSVFDSYGYNGRTGWFTVGGTSASAPMWAARSAVAGAHVDAAYVYGRDAATFRDVTEGNNGAACTAGYDLCTGRGSWVG